MKVGENVKYRNVVIAMCLLALGCVALAQEAAPSGKAQKLESMMQQLNLTPEQKAKVLLKGKSVWGVFLANGMTIFPGGFPLYKGGALVGAIGVSGDGVDQDDLIAFAGHAGFEAPLEKRSDTVHVRGVALPYVVFPRHPDL